ncbi:MAG: ParB/RepB/Spo0J family partition protein [Myxococcaceae bacterium]|nr:ParB/RepB/Spo0J family partition protein [Myxococcaceae bacterium]
MPSAAGKRAIGRGLDALLADARIPTADGKSGVMMLPVDQIRPDTRQPRREFEPGAIEELAKSLQHQGVLQPVLVRKDGSRYRLIAGERRWRAAQKAGLKELPALLRDASDGEAFELALVENLQREDLKPLELAEGYKRLIDERRWTQEQVADRVGKARVSVANALRLLQLPEEVKGHLKSGSLDMGHAKALLGLPKSAEMVSLARAVVQEKLSVRETEARVREGRTSAPASTKKKQAARVSPEARKLVEDLQRKLGTKVRIVEKGQGKGTLEVEFFSYEDLDRIVALIRR